MGSRSGNFHPGSDLEGKLTQPEASSPHYCTDETTNQINNRVNQHFLIKMKV